MFSANAIFTLTRACALGGRLCQPSFPAFNGGIKQVYWGLSPPSGLECVLNKIIQVQENRPNSEEEKG